MDRKTTSRFLGHTIELQYEGFGLYGLDLICERLDRGVANSRWCNMFQRRKVYPGYIAYSVVIKP